MSERIAPPSLTARASISPKGSNEDASVCARHAVPGYSLLAVADGIGSHPRAGTGAALAVDTARKAFLAAARPDLLSPAALVAAAARALGAEADREDIPASEREKTLGTTLICAVEAPAEIRIAYLGNGAVFHLRPALLGAKEVPAASWAATNLLSPHCARRNGKSVLTRFLSAAGPGPATEPTLLTLGRDGRHGDALLLCSDGLWSADELVAGTDAGGKTWQLVEPVLPRVLSVLAPWASGVEVTEKELDKALSACLEELDRERLLDDDCTLAVLCARGGAA